MAMAHMHSGTQSIFNWNNEAVLCLQQGDYGTAAEILQRSLFFMRNQSTQQVAAAMEAEREAKRRSAAAEEALKNPRVESDNDPIEEEEEYVDDPNIELLEGDYIGLGEDEWDEEEPEEGEEQVSIITIAVDGQPRRPAPPPDGTHIFTMFDQAFVTTNLCCDQITHSQSLIRAFLLYNLGLCYHQHGAANHMNMQDIQMAFQLYRNALTTLQDACDEGRPENVVLLLLALFNNIGHIQTAAGNYEGARYCVSWIRALMSTKRGSIFLRMGDYDFVFFCRTVIGMTDVHYLAAGAA